GRLGGQRQKRNLLRGLLVGQSGGPTAVINASLVGVIGAARTCGYTRILGMRHGVLGALAGSLIDLSELSLDGDALDRLRRTPSAALGSCRYKLSPSGDAERLVEICRSWG